MKEIHNNIPYEYGSQISIGTLFRENINASGFEITTDIPITATGVITVFVNGKTYSLPFHSGKSLLVHDNSYTVSLDTTRGDNLVITALLLSHSTRINIISAIAVVYGYGNGKLTLTPTILNS